MNSTYITYILIVVIGILISSIGILIISLRGLNLKLKRVEQQLLLSRINPHFIFNSLTAIQSFIFRQDILQAGRYLSIFAKLVRYLLENSRLETTTIEREIKTLRLYFDLQTLRFEGKFDYRIEIDESLDIEGLTIPPLLTHPFIENSIEHGFIQLSEKGVIIVRFKKAERSIIIEVEDNGIGIEQSKLIHIQSGKNHQSIATEITFERLKKIRQISNLKIGLDIVDLNTLDLSKQGSIVRFNIPVKN